MKLFKKLLAAKLLLLIHIHLAFCCLNKANYYNQKFKMINQESGMGYKTTAVDNELSPLTATSYVNEMSMFEFVDNCGLRYEEDANFFLYR